MRKTLIFLTSSYPFGEKEAFVVNEMPCLAEAFDAIVVLSNDTGEDQAHQLPTSATVERHSYELDPWEKATSLIGLLSPELWREVAWVRRRYRRSVSWRVLATALISWRKARKFAGIMRRIAASMSGAEVHAYSYWANDMAVAAAVARSRGWVHRAYCRAHGWDVYQDRVGYLPFRDFMATHLDHVLFVSEHGRRYFETLMGIAHPSVSCSRLGTFPVAHAPLSRLRPFTVVSCSGLIPLKRVDLIARALAHVTSTIRWIHVGDGPARAAVEAACDGLPGHVTVELRGRLPNPEVLATYVAERPSLFLNVSRTEGLPVSMMEAMSTGIPVMGTDVGGVSEIVSDGSNGVLLHPDPTPLELAAALEAFATMDEATHALLARNAWETWNLHFNADRNYSDFLRITHG